MNCVTAKKRTMTMNRYGTQIRDRWIATAPTRYSQLEDPETFFSEMGELTLARVTELADQLAGQPPAEERYLNRVSRMSSAMRQAEEIALAELEWPEPELTESQARTEWEATRPQDEALIEWANSQETPLIQEELETTATRWMLPPRFLEELATSTNPWTYLAEHSVEMTQSQESRFQRHLHRE
jgi:hypothetical protein